MRFLNRFYLAALLFPLIVIGLVPELRLPLQKLVLCINGGLDSLPTQIFNSRSFLTEEVLNRAPDSLDVQIWAIANSNFPPRLKKLEREKNGNHRGQAKFQAYAQLAREHPDNALLLICALTSLQGSDGRIAGPWEDVGGWTMPAATLSPRFGTILPALPGGIVGPYSHVPENGLATDEIALSLQLSRRGQKLEPDNSFFNWMAARALFAARRDEEAVRELIAGSHKTGFDMHWREFWRASIRSYETLGPLLAEEKNALCATVLLTYLSTLRHVTRMALWDAMQKETAGDSRAALQIEGALARLSMVLNERAFSSSEATSAASFLLQVWSAPNDIRWFRVFNVGKPRIQAVSNTAKTKTHWKAFRSYALQHGRSDLAREAEKMAPRLLSFYQREAFPHGRGDFVFPGSGRATTAIFLASGNGLLALGQFAVTLGLWLFFSVWGPIFPPRGQTPPRLGSRYFIYPLVVISALSIICAAMQRLFLCQAWTSGYGSIGFADSNSEALNLELSYFVIFAPLAVGALFCFTGAAFLKPQVLPITVKPEFSAHDLGASESVHLALNWLFLARRWLWRLFVPALALSFGLFWALWSYFYPSSSSVTSEDLKDVFLGGVGVWLVVQFLRWRFWMPREQRGAVYASFFALRRVLVWSIPLSLWLLLAALWSGIPARNQAEIELDQYLASENAALRPVSIPLAAK